VRRFELDDKYWCISQEDCNVRLSWGLVEGKQQRHDRAMASPEAAAAYLEMQIATQRNRGYVEVQPPPPAKKIVEEIDERPVARSIRFELAGETRTDYRRYPRPAQFTEIEQRDRLLIEWTGEIERPDDREISKRKEKTFPTIAAASDAYDEAVKAVREDNWNWLQVRSSKVQVARNHAALEAQCLADDTDPVPWGVFADWLISEGDPLGEIASRNDDTHALGLIGIELVELGIDPKLLEIGRIHGFPRHLVIRQLGEELDAADPRLLAQITRTLLATGPFRFVDSLQFGLAGYYDRNDWSHTLRVIVESSQVARLRELRFNAYVYEDCEISWATFGDFSGLLTRLPALELLHIKSGAGGTLGEIDLPSLRTFIRESGGLAASTSRSGSAPATTAVRARSRRSARSSKARACRGCGISGSSTASSSRKPSRRWPTR
jgi:predicted DNA-binding WGR domain protein